MNLKSLMNNPTVFIIIIVIIVISYLVITNKTSEGVDNVVNVIGTGTGDATTALPSASIPNVSGSLVNLPNPSASLQATDLLPTYDEANVFSGQNAISNLLKEQNFLISGYHTGLNTISSSKKIPYHDIRSLPPIVKTDVGPWNKSSYDSPNVNRRFFEIGSV